MDLYLLKYVLAVNAHVAERGTLQEQFDLTVFSENVHIEPTATLPTFETLYKLPKNLFPITGSQRGRI